MNQSGDGDIDEGSAQNKLVKDTFRAAMTRDTQAFNPGNEWNAGEIAPLLMKLQKPAQGG